MGRRGVRIERGAGGVLEWRVWTGWRWCAWAYRGAGSRLGMTGDGGGARVGCGGREGMIFGVWNSYW